MFRNSSRPTNTLIIILDVIIDRMIRIRACVTRRKWLRADIWSTCDYSPS